MGWGVSLYKKIRINTINGYYDIKSLFFSRIRIGELEDLIEDSQKSIGRCREKIMMYSSKYSNESIDDLNFDISELLDWYEECVIDNYKYNLALDNKDDLIND